MSEVTMTFSELLARLDGYGRTDEVFVRPNVPVTVDTACLVADPDVAELAEDDWTPIGAHELGMREYLGVLDIVGIRSNLYARWPDATDEELCEAIDYYYHKDAFVPDDFKPGVLRPWLDPSS